jgi:hypothetical protein
MLNNFVQKQEIERHGEEPQNEATWPSSQKSILGLDGRTPLRGFAMTDFLGLPLILIQS